MTNANAVAGRGQPNVRRVTEADVVVINEQGVLRTIGPRPILDQDGERILDPGAVVDTLLIPNAALMDRTKFFGGYVHPKAVLKTGAMCEDCRQLYVDEGTATVHWQRRHSAKARAEVAKDQHATAVADATHAEYRATSPIQQPTIQMSEILPTIDLNAGDRIDAEEIEARVDLELRSRVPRR